MTKKELTDNLIDSSLELLGVGDSLTIMMDNNDYNSNIVFMCTKVIENTQKTIQKMYEDLITQNHKTIVDCF